MHHKIKEPHVRYSSQHRYLNNYLLGNEIGTGSFGFVNEALDSQSNRIVAIKICNVNKEVKTEIKHLSELEHPSVIQLYDHWENQNRLYLVMELAKSGTLEELLMERENNVIPLNQARYVFVELLQALEYIHSKGIVHGDIKPDNILLTEEGKIKVADFGASFRANASDSEEEEDSDEIGNFSSFTKPKCGKGQGCMAFQPPEVVGGEVNFKQAAEMLDIWASGLVLYLMVVGTYPFIGETLPQIVENIVNIRINIPTTLDPMLRDLLTSIFSKQPEDRPTISQFYRWLQGEIEYLVPKKTPSAFVQSRNGKWSSRHSRSCNLL